jgi:hypothetical protein
MYFHLDISIDLSRQFTVADFRATAYRENVLKTVVLLNRETDYRELHFRQVP